MKKLVLSSVAVAALAASLTACGGGDDASPKPAPAPASSAAPSESTDATPSAAPSDSPAASDGAHPAWALPAAAKGDKIASIDLKGQARVDVYQVGTAKATKDGMFVDPDTNKSLIQKGDELVVVSYVVTNTGDKPLPLSFSLVDVTARYADWKWLQGMDGDVSDSIFDTLGVHKDAFDYKSGAKIEAPFELAPGESYSTAENFKYQKNSPITFDAKLVPSDDKGELDFAGQVEAKADAKIK